MLVILLPVVLGPLTTFILYSGVTLVSRLLRRKVRSDTSVWEDSCCLALLVRPLSYLPPWLFKSFLPEVVVHLGSYIPSLIWCDKYLRLPQDIFPFVMIKYVDCRVI